MPPRSPPRPSSLYSASSSPSSSSSSSSSFCSAPKPPPSRRMPPERPLGARPFSYHSGTSSSADSTSLAPPIIPPRNSSLAPPEKRPSATPSSFSIPSFPQPPQSTSQPPPASLQPPPASNSILSSQLTSHLVIPPYATVTSFGAEGGGPKGPSSAPPSSLSLALPLSTSHPPSSHSPGGGTPLERKAFRHPESAASPILSSSPSSSDLHKPPTRPLPSPPVTKPSSKMDTLETVPAHSPVYSGRMMVLVDNATRTGASWKKRTLRFDGHLLVCLEPGKAAPPPGTTMSHPQQQVRPYQDPSSSSSSSPPSTFPNLPSPPILLFPTDPWPTPSPSSPLLATGSKPLTYLTGLSQPIRYFQRPAWVIRIEDLVGVEVLKSPPAPSYRDLGGVANAWANGEGRPRQKCLILRLKGGGVRVLRALSTRDLERWVYCLTQAWAVHRWLRLLLNGSMEEGEEGLEEQGEEEEEEEEEDLLLREQADRKLGVPRTESPVEVVGRTAGRTLSGTLSGIDEPLEDPEERGSAFPSSLPPGSPQTPISPPMSSGGGRAGEDKGKRPLKELFFSSSSPSSPPPDGPSSPQEGMRMTRQDRNASKTMQNPPKDPQPDVTLSSLSPVNEGKETERTERRRVSRKTTFSKMDYVRRWREVVTPPSEEMLRMASWVLKTEGMNGAGGAPQSIPREWLDAPDEESFQEQGPPGSLWSTASLRRRGTMSRRRVQGRTLSIRHTPPTLSTRSSVRSSRKDTVARRPRPEDGGWGTEEEEGEGEEGEGEQRQPSEAELRVAKRMHLPRYGGEEGGYSLGKTAAKKVQVVYVSKETGRTSSMRSRGRSNRVMHAGDDEGEGEEYVQVMGISGEDGQTGGSQWMRRIPSHRGEIILVPTTSQTMERSKRMKRRVGTHRRSQRIRRSMGREREGSLISGHDEDPLDPSITPTSRVMPWRE